MHTSSSPLRAGFARRAVTPPVGTLLMGVGEAAKRPAVSVLDPLYVRALFLEQGGHRVAIIGLDLCFIDRATAGRIENELHRRFGIAPAAVVLNASHTHAGPAVGHYYDLAYTSQHLGYVDGLVSATIDAVASAIEGATDVTVSAGVRQTTLPLNRRRIRDGKAVAAPNPEGPVLRSLPICRLLASDGRTVCLMFSASTHPVAVRGRMVSADYPGAAMRLLDEHLGLHEGGSLFLQGTAGDSRPYNLTTANGSAWEYITCGQREAMDAGRILAEEVIDALPNLRPTTPMLRFAAVETHWPLQTLAREFYESNAHGEADDGDLHRRWARHWLAELNRNGELPTSILVWLRGIQLASDVRLIAMEGEPVAAHGKAIERAFEGGVAFTLGYSNGDAMYLVTSQMLDEGGYECTSYWEYGQPAPLAKGMESVLHAGLNRLLSQGIQ